MPRKHAPSSTTRHPSQIFGGNTFETVSFPGGPFDVPDEVGDGRPKLVVLSYDGLTIGSSVDDVPELIKRIYTRKGSEGSALRALRNNLAFVVADDNRKKAMRRKAYYRLALRELKKPERLIDLAEHQQATVRELEARSEQELAIAIQQCYRHVFYPSRNRVGVSDVDLAHSAIDMSIPPPIGQAQASSRLCEHYATSISCGYPRTIRTRPPMCETAHRSRGDKSLRWRCVTSSGAIPLCQS